MCLSLWEMAVTLNRPGQADLRYTLTVLQCIALWPWSQRGRRVLISPAVICDPATLCQDTALQIQLMFHWAGIDPQNEAFIMSHSQKTL